MKITNTEFVIIGIDSIDRNKFNKIKNGLNNKPKNGLWSCIYKPTEKFSSDWLEYIVDIVPFLSDGKSIQYSIVMQLKEDTKICIIENRAKLIQLQSLYPSKNNNTCVDFESLSKDYDGVFVTSFAIYEGSISNIDIDYMIELDLSSWSIPSMCLFNIDCILNWRRVDNPITDTDITRIAFANKQFKNTMNKIGIRFPK